MTTETVNTDHLNEEQKVAVKEFQTHFGTIDTPEFVIERLKHANWNVNTVIKKISSPFKIINIPINHISNLVWISEHEFITIQWPEYYNWNKNKGIHKFDVTTNKWSLFIQYPPDLDSIYHNICFNPNNKKLYICGCNGTSINGNQYPPILHVCNIETKLWELNYSDGLIF